MVFVLDRVNHEYVPARASLHVFVFLDSPVSRDRERLNFRFLVARLTNRSILFTEYFIVYGYIYLQDRSLKFGSGRSIKQSIQRQKGYNTDITVIKVRIIEAKNCIFCVINILSVFFILSTLRF